MGVGSASVRLLRHGKRPEVVQDIDSRAFTLSEARGLVRDLMTPNPSYRSTVTQISCIVGRTDSGCSVVKKERSTACLNQEYSRLASRYDTRWSRYIEVTTDVTIRHIGPLSRENVLDVGCGTGALLGQIRRKYPNAKLAGIDISTDMLEMAGRRLGRSVELKQGQAESLPYTDAEFDVVVSTSVFHLIRNPHLALTEIRRVLKPHGRVIITGWCDDYLACKVCDLYLRLINRGHFRAYGQTRCRKMMTDAGFGEVRTDSFRMSWIWGFMTAQGLRTRP